MKEDIKMALVPQEIFKFTKKEKLMMIIIIILIIIGIIITWNDFKENQILFSKQKIYKEQ